MLGLYGKMCLPAEPVSETISRSQLMFVLLSPEDICISLLLFLLLLRSLFHGNLLMCLLPPLPPAPFYLQMECEGDLVLTLPRGCAPVVWTGHTSKPTLAVTTCHHQTLLRTQHSSAVSLRLFFFSIGFDPWQASANTPNLAIRGEKQRCL